MTKLLIVDDIEQNIYMLKILLEGHGYQVVSATNGAQALEMVLSDLPDAIISDILMPVMDGFTLCRKIKSDDRLKAIPFIFYTATYTEPKDEKLALSLGAERFMVKPMDPDAFIQIIKDVIRDTAANAVASAKPEPTEDSEVFKLYSERLVNKLEKKMLDLEKEINEHTQTEMVLCESEERYRNLFDSISDCIYTHDLQGRFLTANPATVEKLNAETEELGGLSVCDFMPPESRRFFNEEYLTRIQRVGFYNGVWVYLSKDGREHHIDVRNVLVEQEGQKPYVSCVGRDITENILAERKVQEMEKQLFQLQKMEALGTLAAGIAHDFNNILFPMVGFTEMLKEDLSPDSPLQDNVDEILQASLRARDLVRQILAFQRQSEAERKPIKLQPTVQEALKLLRSSIPKTIDILENIESDCGMVMADSTEVLQVVMNLATNAYHSMEDTAGSVNVTLKQVQMEPDHLEYPALSPGAYACLTVSDTGIGMEKEVLDKMFDPYFTTKDKGKGTGLGLSVVHGIIKSCGGSIRISSDPGKGTECRVYLPIIERKDVTKAPETPEPVCDGTERILLVDDEEAIVRMVRQMLERLGYEVTARTGSVEAQMVFKADPDAFDLVITDMTMPNMTGIELSQQLKKIRPGIPVIICTGFSEQISKEKYRALDIQDFVLKPVVKRDLAKAIRNVLDGKY